jgi:hypothetical protein
MEVRVAEGQLDLGGGAVAPDDDSARDHDILYL